MYEVEAGTTNPFLHLSMHLSISEQCSIDQPRGIRQAVELLAARRNSLHDAHHEAMDCLGQMVWESQRAAARPTAQAYIDCVQRHATRDCTGAALAARHKAAHKKAAACERLFCGLRSGLAELALRHGLAGHLGRLPT